MRIDNARFTGSVDGSQAVASLSGSFTGSGHIELSNTASYNFASASISGSNLILWRGTGVSGQTSSLAIISQTSDTASYVSSSNVDGPFGMDSIQSASYAVSASHVEFADSASYAVTSSHAITASYAVSASHLIGIQDTFRADFAGVNTFLATHAFNSEDIVVQVYQDDATTGNLPNQIVPDNIILNNLNQVQIDFAAPTTGYVVISQGGFLRSGSINNAITASYSNTASYALTASFIDKQSYNEAVTSGVAATFNIVHNLQSAFPIVASYNGANQQVIPDTVEIISANQVDVTFAGAFTGDIVVKK